MSNPSKAWAILTARATSMSLAPGGTPFLTPAQMAQLLQGLERGPFLVGMVKECHDLTMLYPLEIYLTMKVQERAIGDQVLDADGNIRWVNAWPSVRGQQYCRRLAGLAVYELLMEKPLRCPDCAGRGYTIVHSNGVPCDTCGSNGGKGMTSKMKADLATINWEQWRQGWSSRYEVVFSMLTSWYGDAHAHVARAMKEMQSAA